MTKSIFTIIILFIFQMSFAQKEAYYQQHIQYKMDIDVDAKNYQYKGKQQIVYTNNSPDELKKIYIHLYWNAFQPNSQMDYRTQVLGKDQDRRMTENVGTESNPKFISRISKLTEKEIGYQKIIKLKQNEKDVKYKVEGTILEVELAVPILSKGVATFDMEWEAQVPKQIRRSGRQNKEGIELSMTQWYPKVCEYDYEGWHADEYIGREFHGVFGNFDVTIHLDKNYTIGGSGALKNANEIGHGYAENTQPKANVEGKLAWHFVAENIHDFAWAADPDFVVEKDQVSDGPMLYYVYQKNEKTKAWADIKPYLKTYYKEMEASFGKYPYPQYSIVQGGDGGMEYGQCTLIMGEAETVNDLAGLIFHEASHSWFQHVLATNETMRGWMDEGFTSYAEDLMMAKIFPETQKDLPHPFFNAINAYTAIANSGKEEPLALFSDYYSSGKIYSNAVYSKGETFLVQLGYIIGEENLKKTMKTYFSEWKFKHPTDKDFMHIAQKVSGMDLKWFFNLMIHTTYTIDYQIENVASEGNQTKVVLRRNGRFPMPIDLFVKSKTDTEIFYIPLQMMRGEKPAENNLPRTILPDWGWTNETYTVLINKPLSDISQIVIDGTQRLADVNYQTNVYPSQK